MFSREKRLLKKLSAGDDAFKSAVAEDPSTPAAVLQALANDPSLAIRLCVTSNPATSQATLYLLGHDSERQVRTEALARLLAIAEFKSAKSAAMQPDAPPQLLSVIAEDLSTYSSELRALCGTTPSWNDDRERLPKPRADVLTELARARNPEVRAEVAKSDAATAPVLGALAKDSEHSVRLMVAGNSSTPVEVLQHLLRDDSSAVRGAALRNKALPVDARATVVTDPEPEVRQQLAARTDTSVEVLGRLAHDDEPAVRVAVANNDNTPAELLAELAGDPNAEVRLAVALGRGIVNLFGSFGRYQNYLRPTPEATLVALATDNDRRVRIASSGNPRLPLDALEALANDQDPSVREHVARVIQSGYDQPLPWDRQSSSARDGETHFVPTELLARLALSAHDEIRRAVAQHPKVPAAVLSGLLDDHGIFDWHEDDRNRPWSPGRTLMPYSVLHQRCWSAEDWRLLASVSNPQARGVVAFSSGVPDEVVDGLANDHDTHVRLCTLSNSTLPAASLRRLMDDSSSEVADKAKDVFHRQSRRFQSDLGVFVDSPDPRVRAAVAQAQGAQIEWSERLAGDSDPTVRAAVAKNPITPIDVLVSLSADPDSDVVNAIVDTVGANKLSPEALTQLSSAPNSRVRAAVATARHLPDEALRSLIGDPEESVRLAAATNGFHPGAALVTALLGDDSRRQFGIGQENVPRLAALAGDATLDSAALHSLARSPFEEVRAVVAANASTMPATLANMARDPKPSVRAEVARCARTPSEVLSSLARDDAVEVRRGVAANLQSTPDALVQLERDPDPEVALAVSLHPATPPSSLDALIEVHSEPLTSASNSRLLASLGAAHPLLDLLQPWNRQLRDRLLQSDHRWQQGVRQAVAANPCASSAVLSKLAQQPDTAAFAAANPSTPADILKHLATNTDELVREALADNPNTPEAQLGALALDPKESVRIRVASNERTPVRALEILASDFSTRVKDAAHATLAGTGRM